MLEQNNLVRGLDPCQLDGFLLTQLPNLNATGNVDELLQQTRQVLPDLEFMGTLSLPEAQAATRDLGFIAASLIKHQIDLDSVPNLEQALLLLSKITDEVPRDTVYSYGPRNPQDNRMRTFTGTERERIFIRSVSGAMETLPLCLADLVKAQLISISDEAYGVHLMNAAEAFQDMVDAMISVRHAVSPQFFSEELRPYFPPIKIGGETFYAPGGAQMPLLLVDRIVWGSNKQRVIDSNYERYYLDNKRYLTPELRNLAAEIDLRKSLVGSLEEVPNEQTAVDLNLEFLETFIIQILKFRSPHLVVAKSNMQIRPEGSIGSGGYTTDILDVLVNQTLRARTQVHVLRNNETL